MTREDVKKLASFIMEAYKKNYPSDMGVRRVQALIEELEYAFTEYQYDDVIAAYREWQMTSRFAPFPREIIAKLPKPHKPASRHQRITDSDGCVYMYMYDEGAHHDDWLCAYKPWWEDSDPRVKRYWELIKE